MLLICAEYLHIKHYLRVIESPKETREKYLVQITLTLDKTLWRFRAGPQT